MTKQGLDELRLQVEVPTEGLPNLVPNPSGDTGAWGWTTPVSGNAMTSTGSALSFTVGSTSKASYFTTEFLPAIVGKYYSARIDVMSWTASHNIKVRFEWYDTNKVLLSSSTQSAAFVGGANYYGSLVAPASAAYVKLRADFYNGTANPSANASITFMQAMVTYTDTGTPFTKRTNLLTNPSFELDSVVGPPNGWDIDTDHGYFYYYAQSTTYADTGTYSLRVEQASESRGNIDVGKTAAVSVTAGKAYTFQMKVYTTWAGIDEGRWFVEWRKSNGSVVSTSFAAIRTITTNAWSNITATLTAPSGAVTAVPSVRLVDVPKSGVFYLDSALMEEGNIVQTYFDGATTDTASMDYAWTGVAHESTSTATTTGNTFDYSDPNDWQDILGPTHDVTINRNALDVGTLSANITDSDLDPAVANSIIKPGKKVRMQSLVDGAWENLFEGKVSNAVATYEKEDKQVFTRISLSATDNITTLANQTEVRGVATVASLPFILEGKGVPWNVNGSGNQVSSATQVSSNDNASVLDQVAITRDSVLGYAWVDRNNILQAWDSGQLSTTPVVQFHDTAPNGTNGMSYSDIDVNYNTDTCINQVNVKWLRYNASKGTTEEVDYGPYKDQPSIDTWGPHSAEFTIGGTAESSASISAYAQSILTANATPVIRCHSLTTPVRSNYDRKWATLLDLYSPVSVVYADKVNVNLRITGIEHRIIATDGDENWLATYTFDVQGSVASPTWTPSPNMAGNTSTPVTFGDLTVNTGFTASNFIKKGTGTATINAINTMAATNITFATPFDASVPVPTVMVTMNDVTHDTSNMRLSVTNVTRSGFTVQAMRTVGTTNIGFFYVAVAA